MQGYFSVAALFLLATMVLCRAAMMKRHGLNVIVFGKTHRTDFILVPFVLFFAYHLLANAFGWPRVSGPLLFDSRLLGWLGVLMCFMGVLLFLWGLFSFGSSFRVGIDMEKPDSLVTHGAFAVSRNPLYVAFALNLTGFFLIFPNPLFLTALFAGVWLFHRQILREEAFLKDCYGAQYEEYCKKVRRYL